jgi:hypothetical protein
MAAVCGGWHTGRMAQLTVKARIASTHPVEKYGGVRLDVRVLHQMATALNAGHLPMTFDHSALHPISVSNVQAQVVELEGDEYAVDATFDVDEDDWRVVQQRFDKAGVRGGFSFTGGEKQLEPSRRPALVSLAADAAAFSDEERAEAWQLLEATGPAEVSRLYQFSAPELLRVVLDVWAIAGPFVVNIASSGIYDALKSLITRHRAPTVVEIREHRPDGSYSTAVITTSDPTVLRMALETLSAAPAQDVKRFDPESSQWRVT